MRIYKMNRGDTKSFEVKITDNDTPVEVDKMFFTLKTDCYCDEPLVLKKINDGILYEDGIYKITINPCDTEKLEYGRYLFDIEMIKNSIKKTLEFAVLYIEEEVTFSSNEV